MGSQKVLVVAPSRKTRGGITAVVKAYSQTQLWTDWNCYWIETHIDKGPLFKLLYFARSFLIYVVKLPAYQIVHIHFSEPVSAIRKSFFFLFARLFGKKIIVHFHSFSPETTIKSKYRWLYKMLFTKANKAVVLSEYWKREVKNEFAGLTDPLIIYNPSIHTPGLFQRNEALKTNYILFAGTLNDRKGFKDLIKGFSLIASQYPDWKLVFAGNGEIDAGRVLAKELKIESQVEFAGWVSGEKKDDLFNNATIFCLPSYAEGFPMAILDAMSYSIPVVATPVGGVTDVFQDNYHLLIFPPGNIQELSNKLKILINDSALRKDLVAHSSLVIKEKFELSRVVAKINDLYLLLMSKAG